jgi:predicted ATPase
MKINQITYYDFQRKWNFETIDFSNLTLLVGISGVGKTQILKSIVNIQSIAQGKSLNGVKWDIHFTTENGLEYHWTGEFESKTNGSLIVDDNENEKSEFKINSESLSINGKNIIERDNNQIIFNDQVLPKLSPFQSAIAILSEEEDISPVYKGFNKIIYNDQSNSINEIHIIRYAPLAKKYSSSSLDLLKESDLPTQIKLALVSNYFPEIFNQIKEHFVDIFLQVEDIKLAPNEQAELPIVLAEYPFVQLKEKGVNNWISQNRISSGMFRTLMHISELYLSAEGTVILIDEFENSLGVNCIDVLTDLLLINKKMQFIITSHHPYIINRIGIDNWKIVTRQGGVVKAKDSQYFNLGKSKHEAFMQLINLDAYKEGVE